MRGKRKQFWAALLIAVIIVQQICGVYAADTQQAETGAAGGMEKVLIAEGMEAVQETPMAVETETVSETVPETTEAPEEESTEAVPTAEDTETELPEVGNTELQAEENETLLPETETEIETETETGIETETETGETEAGDTENEADTENSTDTENKADTENKPDTENMAVLESVVKQEAFIEADGSLSVKYTIEVINRTPDADAENVTVKAVPGGQAFYYSREGQTPDAQYLDGQLPSCTSALVWENQTIAAGARAEYIFFAHVGEGAESSDNVKAICFVNGAEIPEEKTIWINGELIKPQYAEPQTYTYADDQVTVGVTVPEGVKLPYGTVLCVTPILGGSPEYESAVAEIESANADKSFAEHVLYDIHFACDGQEVEPEGGNVFVSMEFSRPALQIDAVPSEILEDEVVVSHILEDDTIENVVPEVRTTADGAVEQVTFTAGSFTVYALSRAVTYNGVFDDTGMATVTLEDGTEITVNGNWSWFPAGSRVKITPLDIKFPYRVVHGELKNGVGYQIVITDTAGEILVPPGSSYDVTVRKEKGFGFEVLGQGIKGIRSNASSDLEIDTNAAYTGTECTVTGIAPGADSKVLIGSWDYSSDTFTSTGGSYSLGYILNKYNAFIREDLTGTHIVGPVVAGGHVSVALGGSTTSASYPHDVPDYAGQYSGNAGTIITLSKTPVYFNQAAEGKTYTLVSEVDKNSNPIGIYDAYYFASQFVDFDTAMNALQAEAAGFSGTAVEQSSGTVELAMGGKYEFTAAQLGGIERLDLQGTFGDGSDTFIIVKDAGAVSIPTILENGKELESIEAGMNSGVVFLLPNAAIVSGGSGGSVSGHIVAPVADVTLSGGNFNGCVIAKSLSTSAEGHMWNYNGSALQPGSAALKAAKTVDGKIPGTAQNGIFTFGLEEFVNADGNCQWKEIQSVKNQGGSVNFKEIIYTEAGTYWYRIRETGQVEGYETDSTQYVVKVVTSIEGEQVKKDVTYYQVIAEDELIENGTVNEKEEVLTHLTSSGVKFNNRSIKPEIPETVSKTVTKIWKDGNNQDYERPQKVEVQLKADGIDLGEAVELNERNGWSYTWNELQKYKTETTEEIVYTVEEKGPVTGYIAEYSLDTFTITNTKTTEVGGEKTWKVPEGEKLPESITVRLMNGNTVVETKDVTANAEGKWLYSFENLDAYDEKNQPITYTVEEEAIAGYKSEVNGYNITNTKIEPGKTSVSGEKTWNVPEGEKLPESITVNLMSGNTVVDTKNVTANAEGKWLYSFKNLDAYDEKNQLITYTVEEEAIAGYKSEVNGYNITNTKIEPGKTSVSGEKTWNVPEGEKLPKSITVNLMSGNKVVKTQVVTANAEGKWLYSFKNLDAYDENDQLITYTVEEEAIAGYKSEVNGYNITNTKIEPGKTSVSGEKMWKVPEGEKLPKSITVRLMSGNTVVKTQVVTANAEGKWLYSFENLNAYDEKNQPITYTVEEEAIAGYESEVNGYNITNTRIGTTQITGSKLWNDGDNQDGKRPESITVNLFANGKKAASQEVSADESGEWKYAFANLPRYENGEEIVYTVTENPVEDYSTSIDGYVITNSYTPGETSRTVTKVWKDQENRSGTRPASIQVQLLANGEVYGEAVELNAENGWSYTWNKLPEMKAGKTIVYKAQEISQMTGYVTSYSEDTFTITNTAIHFNVNKVDLGNGKDLDGCVIVVIDKETGREIASWTSVKGEIHDFGNVLMTGKSYILREKAAPLGYNYTTDMEFHIGEDGSVTSAVKPITDEKGNEVYLVRDGITVLSIIKVDETGSGVSGAELVIKDADGNIITDEKGVPKYAWTTDGRPHVLEGIPTGNYILSEITAPSGYELAKDVPFTVTNEMDAVNEVTMVDKRSIATGSLTVTKTLKLVGLDLAITAPDETFYVALFADEARTERISEVKAIEFKNQSVSKAVFENLKAGTYYVGETDADGNLLEIGFVGSVGFEPVYDNGYAVELESDTFDGQMSFDNIFYDVPDGFLYEYFLDITKKVVKNGEPYETDEVFYAGVFYDAEFTELYELVELSMNGDSSTTAVIQLPVGGDPGETVTFYVTEVDENGVPLDNGRDLEFNISVDHTEVNVSGQNPRDEVIIVNDYSEEETETETNTVKKTDRETRTEVRESVKTGDDTDYMTYLWLFGISAGTLLLGGWKRRKNRHISK